MDKFSIDAMLDTALQFIVTHCARMVVCSAEPTTYAQATVDLALASVPITPGDFSIGDGIEGGRRLTVAAKNGVVVTGSGTAARVVLVDTANARVLYFTKCADQALTANGSNTTNIPAWGIEIDDPV